MRKRVLSAKLLEYIEALPFGEPRTTEQIARDLGWVKEEIAHGRVKREKVMRARVTHLMAGVLKNDLLANDNYILAVQKTSDGRETEYFKMQRTSENLMKAYESLRIKAERVGKTAAGARRNNAEAASSYGFALDNDTDPILKAVFTFVSNGHSEVEKAILGHQVSKILTSDSHEVKPKQLALAGSSKEHSNA